MRYSVQTAQYKGAFALSHELPVRPVKVAPNLPSGLSSCVTTIAKTAGKCRLSPRHI